MVSLQNEFVCVLLALYYFDSILHILGTCIYQREYSCDLLVRSGMKNFSHIHCMYTRFHQCEHVCEPVSYTHLTLPTIYSV